MLQLADESITNIAERKPAENAPRQSEEHYRLLFESNPHPMWVYDLETLSFLAVNEAAVRHYGYTRDEFLSMTIKDICPPADVSLLLDNVSKVKSGLDEASASQHRKKDGIVIDVEVISYALTFAGRRAELVLATDVTGQRAAEEGIRRAEEKYRGIFENASVGIYQITPDGCYITANDALAHMSGFKSCEEMLSQAGHAACRCYVDPNAFTKFRRLMEERGEVRGFEACFYRRDRSIIWTSENARAVLDDNGRLLYYEGFVKEITEQRQAEQAVRPASTLAAVGAGTCLALAVIESVQHWLIHQGIQEIVSFILPVGLGAVVATRAAYFALKRQKSLYRRTLKEIDERRRAEEALLESEKKYRSLITNIPDVTWTSDSAGRATFISPNVERVFGYTAEEILHHGEELWFGRIHPDDLDRVQRAYGSLFSGDRGFDVEYQIQRKDGRWIWLHDKSVATYEKDGALYADGTFSDITEQKLLEGQLRQAQKLESIGQLAAGIAHEINTPTQYVGDNTRFLQDAFAALTASLSKCREAVEAAKSGALSPGLIEEVEAEVEAADVDYFVEEVPKAISQALDGVGRITKIVQSMKDFAHPGSNEKKAADLNRAIESTVTVARNEWKYVAEMNLDLDPGLPPTPCLIGEFNQVILNMIVNAAHAISEKIGDGGEDKGNINIRTRREGEQAVISVRDTGAGIPAAIRPRIFDPFFTTKGVGKGTGQGLAISRRVIVEKHGGSIDFETEEGEGTTFTLLLPLVDVASGALEAVQKAERQ